MHAQDGRLRHVDDGSAEHGTENAAVGDGEGAAVHVFNGQLFDQTNENELKL